MLILHLLNEFCATQNLILLAAHKLAGLKLSDLTVVRQVATVEGAVIVIDPLVRPSSLRIADGRGLEAFILLNRVVSGRFTAVRNGAGPAAESLLHRLGHNLNLFENKQSRHYLFAVESTA